MLTLAIAPMLGAAEGVHLAHPDSPFPRPIDSYGAPAAPDVISIIKQRATEEPFNVVATVIFFLAVVHTFLTAKIRHWSHVVEHRHAAKLKLRQEASDNDEDGRPDEVSFWGQILHYLGEVEAVFGTWALVLFVAITWNKGLDTAIYYVGEKVNFNEPLFVVIIMTLASTRPVMKLAEQSLRMVARIGKETPLAWWLSILTLAPLIGSFITEPAAMTIAALLLAKQFYDVKPS
ncbi:MAG: putative Na+/H+ antiporter, partial [Cephaloticoccus sp.]|nr:putative Na+/H+ antiporter [Cephaloticoccus sp.]